jgi:hypothetical protein
MRGFLRLNAITILLLVGLAGLGVFAYSQQMSLRQQSEVVEKLSARLEAKARDFSLQEKCAKQAREEFQRWGYAKEAFADLTNHYNERLNKCFLALETRSADKSGSYINKFLADAYEGKQYAEYSWFNISGSGKKYWEVVPDSCKVTMPSGQEITCKSSEEYDELIKAYME